MQKTKRERRQPFLTCLFFLPYGVQKAKGTEEGSEHLMQLLEGERCPGSTLFKGKLFEIIYERTEEQLPNGQSDYGLYCMD